MRLLTLAATFLAGCAAAGLASTAAHWATAAMRAAPPALAPAPQATSLFPLAAGPAAPTAAAPQGNSPCDAYNRQIDEAIALQTRIGRAAEATRLQGMKQSCAAGTAPVYRAARS